VAATQATASDVRLAEVLVALSLATDVGNGFPLEKSLRTALVAASVADELGLGRETAAEVYYVALLRSVGCTAFAHEVAAAFGGDDIAFHLFLRGLDPAHPVSTLVHVATELGAWSPPPTRARSVARFLAVQQSMGTEAAHAACEVSSSLARRLGLGAGVLAGLAQVYERWDGRGIPERRRGEALRLSARITHLADVAEIAHRGGGVEAARAAVVRRRGGHLDPALVDRFAAGAGELLAPLDGGDAWEAAIAAEPAPRARFPRADLERVAHAFADFADLKQPFTAGHSPAVAKLAADAAATRGASEDEQRTLRLAGLLHDLGRTSVPNGVWEKPGPLGAADRERVRLHPYYTERILARSPVLAPLAPIAGAHHERLDGSGYHRGLTGPALSEPMRLLAAADAYQAMTSRRPHRPALSADAAARELRAEVAAGRLCGVAAEAVLAGGGHAPVRVAARPAELTEREVEVLVLLARGLTNKQIAAELVVSPRTVQHHVAHVYAKAGCRTRAGATLFALEHQLLPRGG
jgi:HD-GYP domain-containing protein (c-di-GMP phosphodiesterase class II)